MRTYPHHLTTDLPQLPVPRLEESLERYRTASAAVYEAAGEAEVNQAIADFVLGQAPALQQTLEEYAESVAQTGSNWMAEQWLERYLRSQDPLLWSTNSLVQLSIPTASRGVDRVVELLQRIGYIHILQAKRHTEPEYDADGRRLSMDGWAVFNGGLRTPYFEQDLWMRAGTGATHRTIGLVYLGRMWEVPLTGSEGKLLTVEHLRASVEYVLAQTQPAEQNFVGYSALGSAVLALDAPWETTENRSVYNRLANMLFTLTLDPSADDGMHTLQRWAFQPGHTWVYKPLSYLMSLDGDLLAAGIEHSVLDTGTLATAVTRMQRVDLNALDSQRDGLLDEASELVWHGIDYELTEAYDRAHAMRVERVTVRRDEHLPFDISEDARAQLILMIAQELTFGHIRAHSQCCDMRHFRAGRTETIRPVTIEAVNFVTGLVQDEATEAQFAAALVAHHEWVRAAKTGGAFDRHLLMLQHIGRELGGAQADIFTRYTKARDTFLTTTTTTMSDRDAIVRRIALPSGGYGFGIHYTTVPSGTEYVVTWVDGTSEAANFYRNLQPAAQLLYDFIGSLAPIS